MALGHDGRSTSYDSELSQQEWSACIPWFVSAPFFHYFPSSSWGFLPSTQTQGRHSSHHRRHASRLRYSDAKLPAEQKFLLSKNSAILRHSCLLKLAWLLQFPWYGCLCICRLSHRLRFRLFSVMCSLVSAIRRSWLVAHFNYKFEREMIHHAKKCPFCGDFLAHWVKFGTRKVQSCGYWDVCQCCRNVDYSIQILNITL